jgi:hypothetical protein
MNYTKQPNAITLHREAEDEVFFLNSLQAFEKA